MPSTEEMQQQLLSHHREELLRRITIRIRQSLDLQAILETTVAEVRSFLGTDRVKIYRFHADGSGEVIAESLADDRLPSLLRLNFPADDIPPYARELFVRARQRVTVDVIAQTTTGLVDLLESDDATTQDIRYRPVDPCHVEYLLAMGVLSSVIVPILHRDRLWGLLVSHHSQQRQVSADELQFVQAVADQVEVAIGQSILLSQVQAQADHEAKINQVTALLHQMPMMEPQTALEKVVELFQASGVRLYLMATTEPQMDEFYQLGEQPTALINSQSRQVEEHLMWQQYLKSPGQEICQVDATEDSGMEPWSARWIQSTYLPRGERPDPNCWAITDIYQEPLFRTIVTSFRSTQIRGILIVPLRYGNQILGCLTIFRNEVEIERLWAGECENDTRQQMPQLSFQTWRELKSGQAKSWTEAEKRLAQALGTSFAMAVQQYRLYAQVQCLNANLEQQVETRTAELQQLVNQQQALSTGIANIRASLKLEVIFQTATQEVFRLLEVDRVVIYQFNPDWSGSVIAETVRSGWEPLRQLQTIDADIQAYMTKGDHCVAESFQQPLVDQDRYLQDTDGGNFVRGVVRQVNDIEAMNFPACYLDFLRKFQCRAYIIVPILQADRLWGLLAAFQNSDVRQWQASEANLITQMAVQLGVAIQQAELFHQTKTQAKQLKQTLADLQSTQSQLVQTEKMSSLGQLVAGVAHEINNPINFIHGNLSHATDYTQSLLDLVNLYQARYPDPDAELHDRIAAIDLDFIAADLPKLMSSMRVGTERIREIVLSLRSFSRLDEAEFKVADIHAGIDSTLMILQHRLKPQGDFPGIEVVKEYGQLPLIQCYPGQLNQVFMNLLANGIDALEDYNNQRSITEVQAAPSKITIRTTLHNDQWVMIQIADNGLGMSEEVRSRLFSPFFTTKPVGKGTGLGLSISYQIITERHTGKLYCKSAPGQGAEFVIELPIQYKK